MTQKTLGSEYVITASPDATVSDLAGMMKDQGIGDVIIVEDETPVGIVTDRDLAVKVLAEGGDPKTTRASEVMQENPVTVNRSDSIFKAVQTMVKHGVRRLPILESGKLVNIITLDDALRIFSGGLSGLAQVVEDDSPRRDLEDLQ